MLTYTVIPISQGHLHHLYKSTNTTTRTPSSPLHNLSPPYLSFRRTIRPGLLINLHSINQPVCLRKRTWHQLRMRVTRCRHICTTASPPHILRTRPLPTERGIEDDIHIGEMLIDVAVAGEVCHGCAPAAGIGGAGCDVGGNGGAREEVDVDVLGCPFCGVDSPTYGVEAGTKGLRILAHNGAPGIFLLVGGICVAVCSVDCGCGCHARCSYRAAGVCVQGHLVGGLQVDAFDNVDLAAGGPVRTHEPVCGPGAAPDWYVGDVGYEKTLIVGFG